MKRVRAFMDKAYEKLLEDNDGLRFVAPKTDNGDRDSRCAKPKQESNDSTWELACNGINAFRWPKDTTIANTSSHPNTCKAGEDPE